MAIRLCHREDIVAFIRGFLNNYLKLNSKNRNYVKTKFDAFCTAATSENKWQCFLPSNIIKMCIIECTKRDTLCQLITLGERPPISMTDDDTKLSELQRAIEKVLMMNENKPMYHELCSLLDIRVTVGFSLISPEPYVPKPKPSAAKAEAGLCFVPRGGEEEIGINSGLKKDRKSFVDFINQQPYGWYSDHFDRQENVDLPKGDMRSKEQVIKLIKSANAVNLPKGSEVIIYFAGHGEEGTGNWGAYKMNEGKEVLSLRVSMEDILDAWIEVEEKKKDPGDKLRLTIITDCCYSNQWVKRLQEDIAKGGGSRYGRCPICIQGAASEKAYECTLLPRLLHSGKSLCAGQDPTYVFTRSYEGPPPAMFKERLISISKK